MPWPRPPPIQPIKSLPVCFGSVCIVLCYKSSVVSCSFLCRIWSLRCSMWTLTSGSRPSRSWSIPGLFRETNFPTVSYNTKMPSLSRYNCQDDCNFLKSSWHECRFWRIPIFCHEFIHEILGQWCLIYTTNIKNLEGFHPHCNITKLLKKIKPYISFDQNVFFSFMTLW